MVYSLPVLLEVLENDGSPVDQDQLSPKQQAIRDGYLKARGFWNPKWDGMLALEELKKRWLASVAWAARTLFSDPMPPILANASPIPDGSRVNCTAEASARNSR